MLFSEKGTWSGTERTMAGKQTRREGSTAGGAIEIQIGLARTLVAAGQARREAVNGMLERNGLGQKEVERALDAAGPTVLRSARRSAEAYARAIETGIDKLAATGAGRRSGQDTGGHADTLDRSSPKKKKKKTADKVWI
jgi:hypothetical protein